MAEIVGSAVLSAFFQSLIDGLASQEVVNMFQGKELMGKQLEELKILLLSADKLLDYAEEKQIEDLKVKKWLDELKEVIYLADELIDEVNYEALRCKLEGESSSSMSKVLTKLIPSSFNAFDNVVRSEMEKILHKLRLLMGQSGVLGLKESREKKHLNRLLAPLVQESDVYGRDSVKEAIVESLLMDDHASGHNVSVIPIVGIGGIGKTTLAQLVYNDHRVKERFDHELKLWVTVSTDFDLSRITKEIFKKVTSQDCKNLDLQDVRFQVKEALARKKFLIVLDDVWNEKYEDWDVLRSSLVFGMHGSKILVTTRSAKVASIMANQQSHCLAELSKKDCWQLFTKHAFRFNEKMEEYLDLQEIGKEIVKKCKGNPLAVKSLGGVLQSERNPRKWKDILESNIWELLDNRITGVLPALWLSYYDLPRYLKRCFAYCSVFPKDYFFEREEIILLWMAEGFLQPQVARSRVEDVGEQYLEDLISRSLLQRSNVRKSRFVMHDLFHDLAMYVSNEFCFRLDEDGLLHDLGSKTRHFSFKLASDDLKQIEGISQAKRLHTFIQFGATLQREPAWDINLLTTSRCLRVLSLRGSFIKELPDSIGNLKSLRYLKLTWTDVLTLPHSICALYNLQTLILYCCSRLAELPINIGRLMNLRHFNIEGCYDLRSIPDSICSLHNLQSLLLSGCPTITRLPTNMGHLINLRHLDISGAGLEGMPLDMRNLKGLETLSDFVLSKNGGPNIKELGELQRLRGRLRISGLQNVSNVEDAVKADLKDKKSLNVLALEWKGHSDDSIRERDTLRALQPQKNLREMIISGYGGTSFPLWVGNSGFAKMVSMELSDCENCFFLPPLGKLPFLQELVICNFPKVEKIGDEFYGGDSPFTSLKTLRFEKMPEWNTWSFFEGKKDGAFPHLKKLRLVDCPKLSGGLPIDSHTVETLIIKKCGKIELPKNHAYASLKDLNIRRSHSLEFFPWTMTPKLDRLRVEDCPEIKSFPEGGLPSNLKVLVVVSCPELLSRYMHWDLQRLTSLESLTLDGCEEVLDSFPPQGWLPISVTTFSIENFPHLKALNSNAFQHLNNLRIWECPELEFLPGESLLNSLEWLEIEGCPLLERRYQKEKGEDWHKISHIRRVRIAGKTTRELENVE